MNLAAEDANKQPMLSIAAMRDAVVAAASDEEAQCSANVCLTRCSG